VLDSNAVPSHPPASGLPVPSSLLCVGHFDISPHPDVDAERLNHWLSNATDFEINRTHSDVHDFICLSRLQLLLPLASSFVFLAPSSCERTRLVF
jgi:hypothetical protein